MTGISVNPNLLKWARQRAGVDAFALAGRFPKLESWDDGTTLPSFPK